jgi:hypothetical protein
MRVLHEAAFESSLDQEPSPPAQLFLVRVSGNRPRHLFR